MVNIQEQLDLKKLIKQSNITQKQLAYKLKISAKWLSHMINTDVDDLTIKQLDKILNAIGYNAEILVKAL